MNLHHDKEAFTELIIGAANELAIPTNVIEKRLLCNGYAEDAGRKDK